MTDRSIAAEAGRLFDGQGFDAAGAFEPGGPPAPATGDAPMMAPDDRPRASYTLRVNGVDRPVVDAWIGESLLYVLRERLGLAGAKDGCEQGECGACSVTLDGQLVDACLVAAALAVGGEIHTVEGLTPDGAPSDVQRALAEGGAVQCGYCTPGVVMALHDLLQRNHRPSDVETRQALCGNLCRCTGYQGLLAAARGVAEARRARAEADAAQAAEQRATDEAAQQAAAAQAAAQAEAAQQPEAQPPAGTGDTAAPDGGYRGYDEYAGYQEYPGYDPGGYRPGADGDAHDTGPVYVQLPHQPGPAEPPEQGHQPQAYPASPERTAPEPASAPADEQPVYAEAAAHQALAGQPYAAPGHGGQAGLHPGPQPPVDPLFDPIDAVLGAGSAGTYAPDPYGTAPHPAPYPADPYQADPYRQGHGNDGTIPNLHIPQELYGFPAQHDPGTPPHGTPLPPASPAEDGV